MSSYVREYVQPGAEMCRAVSYDASGNALAAAGPYTTRGAASQQRGMARRRGAVRVLVEVCRPVWEPVPGTEMEA